MKTCIKLTAMASVLAAAAISSPTMAGEIYPASNCEAFYGEDTSKLNRVSNGIWAGSSTFGSRMAITCPIVRSKTDSTSPIRVFARIHNFSSSLGTTCRIVATDWRGKNERVGSAVTVSGYDNFQGVDVYGPTSHSGGTLSMLCYVPKNSRIVNYYVNE